MKISRNWLQTYFEQDLPNAEALSEALTFHAFEIDGIQKLGQPMFTFEDDVLDVKVTPNRGHDCLCHRGIAREISAILKLPLKKDPKAAGNFDFSATASNFDFSAAGDFDFVASTTGPAEKSKSPAAFPTTDIVTISIDTPLCSRYIAGYIKGVKVGPSPAWLRERLEAIGQRSINNIVDATNYVMFDLGQPLHAFDAQKLHTGGASGVSEAPPEGSYAISVRAAKQGEKMLALDEKEYILNESMLVIADANADVVIGIAGVKGGMPASITEKTTDIVLESAHFRGVSIRKTAQVLKLRTDASVRFEQEISPNIAADAMSAAIPLIQQIAGGEVVGYTDVYPMPQQQKRVSVSVDNLNRVLGTSLTGAEVADVLQRLGLAYKEEDSRFEVVVPYERLDLEISEDLIEEVGRIVGYEVVHPVALPPLVSPVEINKNFYWAEEIREFLVSRGFSEVFTSVFAEVGERMVLNKGLAWANCCLVK